ncbi:MAG: hypothetical protein IH865_08690 [Chloroflexi bacterium]|nr:hypothetical protein [Chloroflexota bacterium]
MSADGSWDMTMNTPMGPQTGKLTLKSNGDALEGTMVGPQGEVPLEDGKIDGDNLSWKITAAQMNMVIEFKATVDGDKLTGEAELGSFGKATLEATRA